MSFSDWEGWDAIDGYGGVQFRDCTFKQDVPPFKKGDKVDAIFMDFVDVRLRRREGNYFQNRLNDNAEPRR